MSKELKKTAGFQDALTLHQALANKVITRVVSDGISLRDAVREAIKVAELNKQDIFMLLASLQENGMVHNGDFKNYWSNGWEDSIGSEGIDAHKGTNYYASNKQKVVTANERDMFSLFDYVDTLRSFASDEEIVEANPELEEIVATMNNTQKIITALNAEEAADLAEQQKAQPQKKEEIPASFFQKAFQRAINMYKQREQAGQVKPFEEIFFSIAGKEFPNIDWNKMAPMVQKFIPDYTPLAHINPVGTKASMNEEIVVAERFNGDIGDSVEDENYEEDINALEEAFNLTDMQEEEKNISRIIKNQSAVYKNITRAGFEFARIANSAFGRRLAEDELGFLQKSLQKSVQLYKDKHGDKPFEEVFHYVTDGKMPNINWHKLAPMVKKFIPDYEPLDSVVQARSLSRTIVTAQEVNVEEADPAEDAGGLEGLGELPDEGADPEPAGAEELTVEETAPAEDTGAINVEVTPSPSELTQMAQAGPAWEISNMLSIQKAEEYYNQLKKQLEDVVFNPNIKIDLNGVAQYDKVRSMIDAELNKINEATKGKEKLEKKEDELEEEINEPEVTVEEEVPALPAEAPVAPEANPNAQV